MSSPILKNNHNDRFSSFRKYRPQMFTLVLIFTFIYIDFGKYYNILIMKTL